MQKFASKLLRKIPLAADTFQFDFSRSEEQDEETRLRRGGDFKAGQFFLLDVEDGQANATRAYSIASAPSNKDFFSLAVRLVPGGRASEYLRTMEVGHELHFQGPFGHFFLKDSTKDVVMIATGTGIAPFMGMIPSLFEKGWDRPLTLYFGVRFEEDLFYVDELRAWEKKHPNFKAVIAVSRPTEKWTGLSGRVTEHFGDFDPENTQVYICGNGDMVKNVKGMMEAKGIARADLNFELFTAI